MNKDKNSSVKIRATIAIGPKLKAWADNYCTEREMSFSALTGEALREFLERNYPKGKRK